MPKGKTDRNQHIKEAYAEFLKQPNMAARRAAGLPESRKAFSEHWQIDRVTLYRWENDPDFRRMIHDEVLGVLSAVEASKIIMALKVKAFEGSTPQAKLLLEWAGLIGPQRTIPPAPVEEQKKELENYSDAELRRLIADEDALEMEELDDDSADE